MKTLRMSVGQPGGARWDCHFVLRIKQEQNGTEGRVTTGGLGVQCGRAMITYGVQAGQ